MWPAFLSIIKYAFDILKEKLEAQHYFLEISKHISTSLLQKILRCGSDTLIFVTVEYANKLVEEYSLQFLKEIFNVLETEAGTWYVPDAHEFRRICINPKDGNPIILNHTPIKYQTKQIIKYVMNSIAFFMSNCMKRFFLQDTVDKRQ